MKILFAIILFGLIASINAKIYTKNIPETNYLFSYFYNDEKDGLRLAYSTDGLHFAVMRYNFNKRFRISSAEFYKFVNRFFWKIELSTVLDTLLEALKIHWINLKNWKKSAKNVRMKNIFTLVPIVARHIRAVITARDTTAPTLPRSDITASDFTANFILNFEQEFFLKIKFNNHLNFFFINTHFKENFRKVFIFYV